ncbi:PPIP5K2 [Branchiostoma lanceolatum]|uniref:Inositol hexakisphosphate and diphosphoinositol-pentakisphosphate kinase n=1 Tax=Branchiostoma lanceolatum TaxID=7740 RepID=A0A8K0A9D2_BRALA|nr:PPIP5K2 [Branchiostoma lanceolatum]
MSSTIGQTASNAGPTNGPESSSAPKGPQPMSPSGPQMAFFGPSSAPTSAASLPTPGSEVGSSQENESTGNESDGSRAGFFIGDDEVDDADARFSRSDSESQDSDYEPDRPIVVGICSMAKKAQSKPMKEICARLEKFKFLKVLVFEETVILNKPVEEWPLCDCIISFYSKGFPLDKAVKYARLRKPYLVNNLDMQYLIQDRREVYRILQEQGIELPRYAVFNRDSGSTEESALVEGEDQVEVDNVVFQKPFVEKPVSAEDHNVYIYYPTSAGGGSQRLFRKIGNRSSVYSPESCVRKTGSYIYEEFMPTDGTDVKVYTVGPEYAHAEARKSPALDGKVERDSEGKEVRYPVILNNREKLIAKKVCLAFQQTVCGFDLLRANGKSYVCDVNGFSFVKNSMKYYDDCAKILGNMIMKALAPRLSIPWSVPLEEEDIPIVPTTSGTMMELRCVIGVIRHGDRTPKQKMKMEVRHAKFFEVFRKYGGYKKGKLKLKRPQQLQEILDVARYLLHEIENPTSDPEIAEKRSKLEQLKSVLEMYGHFSGINRKVQLKYQPQGFKKQSSSEDGGQEAEKQGSLEPSTEPSILLILKWGGELTPAGRVQAEELGRAFRCMYPGGQGDYAGFPGCGLLRLHSTYRHDLKIYASDEGRVQMTAAAFAKGLLALEGELTPILVQMVKSANMNGLLDNDSEFINYHQCRVKSRLHEIMRENSDFDSETIPKLAPTQSTSLVNSINLIKNPVTMCHQVYQLVQSLTAQIRQRMEDTKYKNIILYHSETLELMHRRWAKLEKDFKLKSGQFDISKIPDVYDCIKYDVMHNSGLNFDHMMELYTLSKSLADVIIPQEYGIMQQEKLEIAQAVCTPLLKKIRADLQRTQEDDTVNRLNPKYSRGILSPDRHVRTRLYFTSESHIHSLLSILRYGGLCSDDEQWKRALEYMSAVTELNYMTQIVIMLYEDPKADPDSETRFHVELHFSPGAKCFNEEDNFVVGPGFRPIPLDPTKEEGANGKTSPKSPKSPKGEKLHARRESSSAGRRRGERDPSRSPTLPVPIQQKTDEHRGSGHARQPGVFTPLTPAGIYRELARSWHELHTLVMGKGATVGPSGQRNPPLLRLKEEQRSVEDRQGLTAAQSLFSNTILSSSSSAPNLQTYNPMATGRKFSAPHVVTPVSGIESYSTVPSIHPLETLHNSLSLKQIDDFFGYVIKEPSRPQTPTTVSPPKPSTPNMYIPRKVQPSNLLFVGNVNSSWPTSAASSAGPSSPTSTERDMAVQLDKMFEKGMIEVAEKYRMEHSPRDDVKHEEQPGNEMAPARQDGTPSDGPGNESIPGAMHDGNDAASCPGNVMPGAHHSSDVVDIPSPILEEGEIPMEIDSGENSMQTSWDALLLQEAIAGRTGTRVDHTNANVGENSCTMDQEADYG